MTALALAAAALLVALAALLLALRHGRKLADLTDRVDPQRRVNTDLGTAVADLALDVEDATGEIRRLQEFSHDLGDWARYHTDEHRGTPPQRSPRGETPTAVMEAVPPTAEIPREPGRADPGGSGTGGTDEGPDRVTSQQKDEDPATREKPRPGPQPPAEPVHIVYTADDRAQPPAADDPGTLVQGAIGRHRHATDTRTTRKASNRLREGE